jgi:hypothetical protein
MLSKVAEEVAAAREQAGALLAQGAYPQAATVLESALKNSKSVLHSIHYERFECHALLTDVLSQQTPLPFDKLATHARLALHCMEAVYGRPCINPRAATVQLILGDCWLNKTPASAATVTNALVAYDAAANVLETAWGKEHAATIDAAGRAAKVRARQAAATACK